MSQLPNRPLLLRRPLALLATLAPLAATVPSCSSTPAPVASTADASTPTPDASPDATPDPQPVLGAATPAVVTVPASMSAAPFNVERTVRVAEGFPIAVHARVQGARFLAITPDGDLLVSRPGAGAIARVHTRSDGTVETNDFVTGMRKPHDMVFDVIDGTTYLYVSETHQVVRFVFRAGDTTVANPQVVVANLPDSSTPELRGAYGHELKNIAISPDHKLYVSIASTCNVCESDAVADPVRGSVYVYDADGKNGRIFSRGIRNAEGLAFHPQTRELWLAVNNRDNLPYPHDDGTGKYGKIIPEYVDDHPPEEVMRAFDGANFGWPFCNPNPDTPSGMRNMPFDRDYDTNRDGSKADCAAMARVDLGLPAHTAPLGMTFLGGTAFPERLRAAAVIGLHGSWNRTRPAGYEVVYIPWTSTGPGAPEALVTGFLNDSGQPWGRPVDAAVGLDGALYVSDDFSGTIYKLVAR